MAGRVVTAKLAQSVKATAELMDISQSQVRRLIAAGELRAVRLLGKTVVPTAEIERVLGIEPPAGQDRLEMAEAIARILMPNE